MAVALEQQPVGGIALCVEPHGVVHRDDPQWTRRQLLDEFKQCCTACEVIGDEGQHRSTSRGRLRWRLQTADPHPRARRTGADKEIVFRIERTDFHLRQRREPCAAVRRQARLQSPTRLLDRLQLLGRKRLGSPATARGETVERHAAGHRRGRDQLIVLQRADQPHALAATVEYRLDEVIQWRVEARGSQESSLHRVRRPPAAHVGLGSAQHLREQLSAKHHAAAVRLTRE